MVQGCRMLLGTHTHTHTHTHNSKVRKVNTGEGRLGHFSNQQETAMGIDHLTYLYLAWIDDPESQFIQTLNHRLVPGDGASAFCARSRQS